MSARNASAIAFVPRVPSLMVERDELVHRLERESEHPLLIVRGAPGSGKSTLLATWAARQPRGGVWVGLDRSASDRLTFWRRVVESIIDARLVAAGSVLHELDLSVEIESRLRALLHRGFSTTSEPITVILDDFHEAPESVHEDVHWLLRSGASARFVLATRSLTLLERPERVAQVDTAVVLPSALAFHSDEVAAMAGLFQVPDAAADVYRAFSGFPLPTRAALLQLRDGSATTIAEAIERVREVGDSFVLNLLDDAGYGDFLMRVSVARRLTRDFAVAVGGSSTDAHLEHAERDGLGTWSSGAGLAEFVLHPYVRERLEQEFSSRLPEQVENVRRAYAREREKQGDAIEIARQYAAIGDGEQLAQLVRRYYGDLLQSHEAFIAILASVDEREVGRYPELLAVQFLAASARGQVAQPGLARMASLATSVVYARLGGGEPVDRVTLLLILLGAQRVGGYFDQALKTAERLVTALSLLDKAGNEALKGVIPRAWPQLATTFLYNDEAARAEACLSTAINVATSYHRPWALIHAESLQDLIVAMRGDLSTLVARLDAARNRRGPSGWRGTYSAAGYHLAEAYLALENFDGDAARLQLDELAPHEPTIEHWPLIARIRALSSLVEGRPYLGLQTLASDIAAHADRPLSASMTTLLAATRADLLLADGHPHRAAQILKPLRREPAAQLVRARVHLVLGEYDRALGLAAPLAWSEDNRLRAKAEALLVVAAASHRLNQPADAQDAASRVVPLLETFGLRRPLMSVPRQDLIAVLESAGIPYEGLLEGVPDVYPKPVRDWSLTATELRVLALLERTGRIDEIAAEMRVSANTVKSHLRQVYRKLGVRSRSEALGVASLHGLVREERFDDRADGLRTG